MIPFQKIDPRQREAYMPYLNAGCSRGCEYSFANLNMWGRQRAAILGDYLVLFSQFERKSVYPYPRGCGDIQPVLDAIIHDAGARGIPCRISSMSAGECDVLERLYPGKFYFHTDRDNYDYVYKVEDLALLKGKRYQSKRNFVNRFWANHPDCRVLPLDESTLPAVEQLLDEWYLSRVTAPGDFHLEQVAIQRGFDKMEPLGLEGIVLMENGKALAMAMGSFLCDTTFDIHFEKAADGVDGAYAAINQSFAKHLMDKYPQLCWLNREDDLGIEGLRKAKLSYHPDHLVEKYWARLWEDADES